MCGGAGAPQNMADAEVNCIYADIQNFCYDWFNLWWKEFKKKKEVVVVGGGV